MLVTTNRASWRRQGNALTGTLLTHDRYNVTARYTFTVIGDRAMVAKRDALGHESYSTIDYDGPRTTLGDFEQWASRMLLTGRVS